MTSLRLVLIGGVVVVGAALLSSDIGRAQETAPQTSREAQGTQAVSPEAQPAPVGAPGQEPPGSSFVQEPQAPEAGTQAPLPPQETVPGAAKPAVPLAPPQAPVPAPLAPPVPVPKAPPIRPVVPSGIGAGSAAKPFGPAKTLGKEPIQPGEENLPLLLSPSNDARPHEGRVQSQPVYLDFEGVELSKIIKAIGAQTGKNFLLDPQLGAVPVTLVSHAPISPDMLLPALQAVLVTHGFSMRETLDGQLIEIRPIAEGAEKSDIVVGKDKKPKGFEEFSTHIVPVRYASAEDLAKILPRLGSKEPKVDAYGPTNTLIMTDNAHGIRNMLKFLEQIDVPGSEIVMEMFTLEYSRADVVAKQIQDVLLGTETSTQRPGAPGMPVRPPTSVRPPVPGAAQQQTIIGAEAPELRIVPDERLNMLIVMAPESLMKKVRDLMDKLDSPTPIERNNMHVYELLNADAVKVAEKLNAIVGGAPPRPSSGEGGGRAPGMPMAQQAISSDVQPFEKKVLIQAYEATNSLLIVASPQDYAVIKELIAQLDVPQRQVQVQAIIMEVVIQDRFELAVETTALSGNDGFAINNVVQLANLLSGGPFANVGSADSPVITTGVLDGTVDIPVAGADGGITLQTVPKVPLLLTALDSLTDLDVLSQPLITTVDNEEANITIGEEVPIVRGTSTSLDQSVIGRNIYSNVDRKDVGIKMKAKPQISEGDYVFLELEVEVSQPKQSDVGADPNIVGPTFQKSNVKNKVVIRDGATGVVGGLIMESTDHSRRQTPYLGDVPVVGWLFRRKADRRVKRNLVVLVTPNVIKEGVDSDRITQHRIEEFKRANLDVMFEKGVVRRIEKKHYLHSKHRPSAVKVNEMTQGAEFERGDVRRK